MKSRKKTEGNPSGFSGPYPYKILFSSLLMVVLVFFAVDLFQGNRVLSGLGLDLSTQFLQWEKFGFGELKRGHLALWNPHSFCGEPFFGEFQSGLLYPLNWLFLVLPPPFAIHWVLCLHFFLGASFTCLWLSIRKSHPLSCWAGGLMFIFGGSFYLHLLPGHLSALAAMAWIPLLFAALESYLEKRRLAWILLGILAVALQILAGHLQYTYYTALGFWFYLLLSLGGRPEKIRILAGGVLIYVGGAALAAVQLLAGWAAGSESVRGHGISAGFARYMDLQPEALWTWLMPGLFGDWNHRDYWGHGNFWEDGFFIGVAGFVLACYGLSDSRRRGRKTLFFLVLLIAALACSRTFLFNLFLGYFPFFDHFRGAVKFNILITLFLIALAAMGIDRFLRDKKPSPWLMGSVGAAFLLFAGFSLLFYLGIHFGWDRLFRGYADKAPGILGSLLRACLGFGALGLTLFLSRYRSFFRYGPVVLMMAELLVFAIGNRDSFDLKAVTGKADSINEIYRRDPGDYRVLVSPIGANDAVGTLGSDIAGYNPIIPYRYARFISATQGGVGIEETRLEIHHFVPALGLTRLRYVLEEKGGTFSEQRLHLSEMPRALLVSHWEKRNFEVVLQKVTEPSFDFKKTVWLESDPGVPSGEVAARGSVAAKELSTDVLEIEAWLEKPALLVISDNFSRDWKARALPGSTQSSYRVMPANGFQRAIPLEAGKHRFLMEYRPTAYVVGKWISIFAWMIFAGLCFWKRPSFS